MPQDLYALVIQVLNESRTFGHPNQRFHGSALRLYDVFRLAKLLFPSRERGVAYLFGFCAGLDLQNKNIVPREPFAGWTDQAKEYAEGIRDAVSASVLMAFYLNPSAASAEGGA